MQVRNDYKNMLFDPSAVIVKEFHFYLFAYLYFQLANEYLEQMFFLICFYICSTVHGAQILRCCIYIINNEGEKSKYIYE